MSNSYNTFYFFTCLSFFGAGVGVGALHVVLGGIQVGLEDWHNHIVEILLLGNAEEATDVVSFTMTIKIMVIAGKIDTYILLQMKIITILVQLEDHIIELASIMHKEGVKWEHHASMCIMTILIEGAQRVV